MKVNIAYKFRLYPNKEQESLFSKTFGCTRFIYNKMLEDKIRYYELYNKTYHNTPAMYKGEYEFLKEVDSLALSNVQLELNRAFQNFFQKRCNYPKYKSKKHSKLSYTTNNQGGTIKLENGYIKLPKVGLVKIKVHREIPDYFILKSATISKNKAGKYYISILFEYEKQIDEVIPNSFIGLDYSMKELYVDSLGNTADYPKFYRKTIEKLKKEQRKLSKMVIGSNNYKKQKHKINVIYEHITNQRNDFLHKTSRKLVDEYDAIAIEDLNMKSLSQCLKFGKSVLDNAWGRFTNMLEYKLRLLGKKLIKVDKFFASTQTCNVCGYKNEETKDLSIRIWECPNCHTIHDRDYNSAINIKNEGMKLAYS